MRHGLPRQTAGPFAVSASRREKSGGAARGVPSSREKPAPEQRASTVAEGSRPSTCTRAASSPAWRRTRVRSAGSSSTKCRGILPGRTMTATRSASTAAIHPNCGRLAASRTVPVLVATPLRAFDVERPLSVPSSTLPVRSVSTSGRASASSRYACAMPHGDRPCAERSPMASVMSEGRPVSPTEDSTGPQTPKAFGARPVASQSRNQPLHERRSASRASTFAGRPAPQAHSCTPWRGASSGGALASGAACPAPSGVAAAVFAGAPDSTRPEPRSAVPRPSGATTVIERAPEPLASRGEAPPRATTVPAAYRNGLSVEP
ncbi:hypothetical protein COEX109129_39720 [Corallococcus exiguus]